MHRAGVYKHHNSRLAGKPSRSSDGRRNPHHSPVLLRNMVGFLNVFSPSLVRSFVNWHIYLRQIIRYIDGPRLIRIRDFVESKLSNCCSEELHNRGHVMIKESHAARGVEAI